MKQLLKKSEICRLFKINYKDNDYCLGTDFNNIIKCDNEKEQTSCKPNKLYVENDTTSRNSERE